MPSARLAATALILITLCLSAAGAARDPVTLPFEDGFEGRTRRGMTDGWRHASAKRSATVTGEKSFRGKRSLGVTGRKSWADCAHVVLPKLPDQLTYRFSVLPPGESKRAVRAGFFDVAGRKARFYNFVNLRTEDGRTGWVFFKRGLNARPVQIGKYRAGKWITVGVHLDFEKRLARVWLDGKEVAKDVPILPREFNDPRHGRVVLEKFAVGHRYWLPGAALRAHVDDVRIAMWTGEPPTGEKARTGEVDRLIEMLGHEDRQRRRDAAEGLAKIGDRRAVPPLIARLGSDESWLVRQEAARALGLLGDERAAKALLVALGDDSPPVRKAVVAALAAIGGPRAIVRLMTALRSKDGNVRHQAGRALAKLGPPAASALVTELTGSSSAAVRRSAGDALAAMGPAAVEAAVPLLNDGKVDVRQTAVSVLSRVGDKRAVEPLVSVLREDSSPVVRGDAARALGRLGDGRAFEPLVHALDDRDRGVRRLAVEALGSLGDPRGVPLLARALSDRDSQLRIIAAYALGSIGGARSVEPLLAALEDESDMVRTTAVHALGKVKDEGAFQALVGLLEHEDVAVRADAAGALGSRGDARATAPLQEVLRDPAGRVRTCAAVALERLGWKPGTDEERAWHLVGFRRFAQAAELGKAAIAPLIAALTDMDRSLRIQAAQVLPAVGPSAIEPLVELGDHDDPEVRRMAAQVLEKLGHRPRSEEERARQLVSARRWKEAVALGEAAVAPLVEALRERDAGARRSAAQALDRVGWKPSTDTERAYRLVALGKPQDAAALGPDAALEPLVNALPVSASVMAALGDLRAVEPLIESLRASGNVEVIDALAALGDRRAVPELIARLADRDEYVRIRAAVGLGVLGDERAREPLRKAVEGDERTWRLEDLAKEGNREAIAWLGQARLTRVGAAAGLHLLGDESALDILIAALDDRFTWVRAVAARVLPEVAPLSERTVPALEAALGDAHWRVRAHAADGIMSCRVKQRSGERGDHEATFESLTIRRGDFWEWERRGEEGERSGRIEVVAVYADGVVHLEASGFSAENPTMFWQTVDGFLVWDWLPFTGFRVLRLGAKVGDTWTSIGGALLGEEWKLESKVEAVEDLETSAGKLGGCRKVVTRFGPKANAVTMWWAKAVGPVKLEFTGEEGSVNAWTLAAYRVGGKD